MFDNELAFDKLLDSLGAETPLDNLVRALTAEENSQYGPDQSADFFETGGLETVSEPELAYIVDDVDYCIGQALDMTAGRGDYSYCEPQPSLKVLVVDLDRSAYPICKRS